MLFSDLSLHLPGKQNEIYGLRDKLLCEGKAVLDLTKPAEDATKCGLAFPPNLLAEIMREASLKSGNYNPDPFGQKKARDSIAEFYYKEALEAGLISGKQILITPGSSFSYFYCFKTLADSSEEFICPKPSYPLLDYIARIAEVRLVPYSLREGESWHLDLGSIEALISPKTRGIVLISPHNPTGMICGDFELDELARIANKHELPIIFDEVFSEFCHARENICPMAAKAPLVLTLNGLSKSLALPGMKIGWIAATGEEYAVKRTLGAMEIISDTFLPVNEIAQFALPDLLARSASFKQAYQNQVHKLRTITLACLKDLSFPHPDGGFYISLPIAANEIETVKQILLNESILLHPGHFYEMDGEHLIFSFLQSEEKLQACLERIKAYLS